MTTFWQDELKKSKKVQDLTCIGVKQELAKIAAYADAYTADDLFFAIKELMEALNIVNSNVEFNEDHVKKEKKETEKEKDALGDIAK